MSRIDPIGIGYEAARVSVAASEQEALYRAERADRARSNLAVTALERFPGDDEQQERWLGETLDMLGLRVVRANPKTASSWCDRCAAPRPAYRQAAQRSLCHPCSQAVRREREQADG